VKGDSQRWWNLEFTKSFPKQKEQRGQTVHVCRFYPKALTPEEVRRDYELFCQHHPDMAKQLRKTEARIREAENIKAAIALQDGIYPVPAGTPVHFVLVGGMDVNTARPVTMTIDTSEGETEELTEDLTEESRPCPLCNGGGKVEEDVFVGDDVVSVETIACPRCGGSET
jgi:hypothetical protein